MEAGWSWQDEEGKHAIPDEVVTDIKKVATKQAADRYCKNVCGPGCGEDYEHPGDCECAQRAAIMGGKE